MFAAAKPALLPPSIFPASAHGRKGPVFEGVGGTSSQPYSFQLELVSGTARIGYDKPAAGSRPSSAAQARAKAIQRLIPPRRPGRAGKRLTPTISICPASVLPGPRHHGVFCQHLTVCRRDRPRVLNDHGAFRQEPTASSSQRLHSDLLHPVTMKTDLQLSRPVRRKESNSIPLPNQQHD